MTEENRIDFDLEKPFAITRMEVPLPKFNTGDKVFYVNWDGDVTEREIDEVQYNLTFCNNGYVNFAKYEITYSFMEGGFGILIKKVICLKIKLMLKPNQYREKLK